MIYRGHIIRLERQTCGFYDLDDDGNVTMFNNLTHAATTDDVYVAFDADDRRLYSPDGLDELKAHIDKELNDSDEEMAVYRGFTIQDDKDHEWYTIRKQQQYVNQFGDLPEAKAFIDWTLDSTDGRPFVFEGDPAIRKLNSFIADLIMVLQNAGTEGSPLTLFSDDNDTPMAELAMIDRFEVIEYLRELTNRQEVI